MNLTSEEKEMLSGKQGKAVKKSMEILVALGEIYGAKRMVEAKSVQIAGVSYHNLGDAGLEFLEEMGQDGKVKVLTTLNPAGMDLEEWQKLGIDSGFAEKQMKVIDAFSRMGVTITCTCTPYLIGNLPRFGEHIAWSESSAVCFANSVIGAITNREGGPSSIASALTGKTPEYGMHLEKNRQAQVRVLVKAKIDSVPKFGAMGRVIGEKIGNKIPLIEGIQSASLEELKSLSAAIATYGGTAMFHMKGITPAKTAVPKKSISIGEKDIAEALGKFDCAEEIDFVGIGCPHASINEMQKIAELLKGKKVKKEVWVCTARQTKQLADKMGYSKAIEDAGAKIACDTCMAVAPIKGRFKGMITDSAKACYYAAGHNGIKTRIRTVEECVEEAMK
ncbi:MAG: aconitase X catalytic domain-containing protein [Candidatus Diapherotrites archaeon]|nr:aconitase X catalytic domain-containing protein [Candidatus Diapherotrites archaeon]